MLRTEFNDGLELLTPGIAYRYGISADTKGLCNTNVARLTLTIVRCCTIDERLQLSAHIGRTRPAASLRRTAVADRPKGGTQTADLKA